VLHIYIYIYDISHLRVNSYRIRIAYQFKTHNKCSNGPLPKSMQVRKHLTVTVAPFQRTRWDCESSDRHKYWVHKMSFIFKWSQIYWAFFGVPTNKKFVLKIWSKCQRVAPQTFCAYNLIWTIFLVLVWGGPNPEICPNILNTHCIRDTRLWKEWYYAIPVLIIKGKMQSKLHKSLIETFDFTRNPCWTSPSVLR